MQIPISKTVPCRAQYFKNCPFWWTYSDKTQFYFNGSHRILTMCLLNNCTRECITLKGQPFG